MRSTILRISVFYLGSVLVITFLLPYSTLGGADTAAQSSFTQVLDRAGIRVAAGFLEVIIMLASLVLLSRPQVIHPPCPPNVLRPSVSIRT